MRKTIVLLLVLCCTAVLLGAAGSREAGTASEGPYRERLLRFGTTSAETSDVVRALRFFAQKVNEGSGGSIVVEVFPGGTLGDVRQMSQSAQMGALDMTLATPTVLADMGARKFMVLNFPFIFAGHEHSWKVLDGEIGVEILDSLDGMGLIGLGYYKDGARNFFTTSPVRNLEDLRGKKIRVQPTALDTDMASALGINPTPIAFAELYSALQTGVVVGAENPTAGYFNGKYYEVCRYFTISEHSNPPVVILFSEIIWKQLNDQERNLIQDSWLMAQEFNKENVVKSEAALLDKIRNEGVEVIEITDKEKWVTAMQPVYSKHGAGLEDLIARIQGIR